MQTARLPEQAEFRLHPGIGGVGVLRASYRRHSFVAHAHDTWTFATVTRGAMNVEIGGVTDRLEMGSIIAIPPGVIHAATPAGSGGWDYISVYPAQQLVEEITELLPKSVRASRPQGVIRSERLSSLCREFGQCDGASLTVLARLLEGAWYASPTPRRQTTATERAIEDAKAFIAANVCRRLSLDEMAGAAAMSKFHFVRRFRRFVGATPYAFYSQLRVDRARQLLTTGVPIVEAAHRCGFMDQSHLNRHFKRVVGVTPGGYQAGITAISRPR